jgi:hypothetical protein
MTRAERRRTSLSAFEPRYVCRRNRVPFRPAVRIINKFAWFPFCLIANVRGIGNRFVYVLRSDVDPARTDGGRGRARRQADGAARAESADRVPATPAATRRRRTFQLRDADGRRCRWRRAGRARGKLRKWLLKWSSVRFSRWEPVCPCEVRDGRRRPPGRRRAGGAPAVAERIASRPVDGDPRGVAAGIPCRTHEPRRDQWNGLPVRNLYRHFGQAVRPSRRQLSTMQLLGRVEPHATMTIQLRIPSLTPSQLIRELSLIERGFSVKSYELRESARTHQQAV